MPFDPHQFTEGQNYDGVIRAAKVVESQQQNPGVWVRVETDEGDIDGAFYITPQTRDRFQENMEQLGISLDTLASDSFWEDPGPALIDLECSVVPEINEYNGKQFWRIRWLNPRRRQASTNAKQRAASMFRQQPVVAGGGVIMPDPDVPF